MRMEMFRNVKMAMLVLALSCIAVGCATQLVDSRGNPVRGESGNIIRVSGTAQEKSEKYASAVRDWVCKEIDRTPDAELSKIKVTDAQIKAIIGADSTAEDIAAVRALAEAEARLYLTETVYPKRVAVAKKKIAAIIEKYLAESKFVQANDFLSSIQKTGITEIDDAVLAYAAELNKTKVSPMWATSIISRVRPFLSDRIADGQYEKAREVLWRAPTTGNADVDSKVREFAIEQMRTVVNPAEWKAVESQIKQRVSELAGENKFDESIRWLKSYPRVRTHSIKIDEKLKTVEGELVKLGISEESMKPILDATGKLVSDAANILDLMDGTTNVIITADGKKVAEVTPPDLKAYEERLEEYRQLLLRYDCTEAAAKNIMEKFGADVDPLLKSLSQTPSKGKGEEVKIIPQLGTAALNKRIDKLTAELVVEQFSAQVKWLVQEGKFEEAREIIWKSTSAEDADRYAPILEVGHELMLKVVNPAHWTAIANEFAEKVKKTQNDSKYDEAIAWCEAYPDIRTFSSSIDERLADVKDQLTKLGLDADKIQPIIEKTLKASVNLANLADSTDSVKKTEGKKGDKKLPLEEYEKLLADYRTALVRNGCTDENADKLVGDFKKNIAPFLAMLAGEDKGKDELSLGANAINVRLQELRGKTIDTLKSQKYRYVFTDLIAKVSESVSAGKYTDARKYIRDVPLVQDAEWDARIYATRIGLLNSTVNPNQCATLLKEIDAKAKELFDAKKYDEFRDYAKNYEYVHDTYKQIADALRQVKTAMAGLTIAEEDAGQYIDKLSIRIREMQEKRTGTYSAETDKDLKELEKALAELEKGIVVQYYRPEELKAFCGKVKQEILSLIVKTSDPMTTWEMNEMLKAHLAEYLVKADTLSATDTYEKLLAGIDAEISFDSQIAMAEDAIAKQLGVHCPEANLKVNALLGEYARAMRLLKAGQKIDSEQALVLLLGGVYLEQTAVITRALEFGADVNGVSARDPLARTAVLLAIQTGHNSCLKQLSDAKASLTATDANGDTALHYAVHCGNLSVVKAMLAKNDVNKTNKAGETALFIAVRKNQAAVTSALIAMKADVKVKNAQGETVMDTACITGSRDVLDLLANAGAAYGSGQLKLAAAKDHLAVAQWLVGKCVDVNAPGVMEATVCQSDTQRYLVHEGGVLKPFGKDCCVKESAVPRTVSPKKLSESSGMVEPRVSKEK